MKKNFILIVFLLVTHLTLTYAQKWEECNNGLYGVYITSLAIKDNLIFAGTRGGGCFLSTNYGGNWEQIENGLTSKYISCIAVKNNNIFVGTSDSGVYRSTNNGTDWIKVNNGLKKLSINCMSISQNNIFIGLGSNGGGVYLSTNDGQDWIQTDTIFGTNEINCLATIDSKVFASDRIGIYLSTNNGISWKLTKVGVYGRYFISSGTNLLVDANKFNGIFLSSDDGNSWSEIGLKNENINCIICKDSNIMVGTQGSGVFLCTQITRGWIEANDGLDSSAVFDIIIRKNDILVGTSYGVYESTNNGTNWTNMGLRNEEIFCLADSGSFIYAGSDSGKVFISSNNGVDWTKTTLNPHYYIRSLVITGNYIFASSGGLFLSTDNGISWTIIKNGLPDNGYVTDLAVDNSNLYVGTSKGLYFSINNGDSWTKLNHAWIDENITCIKVEKSDIYVCTYDGYIHYSTNNGINWTEFIQNEMTPKFNTIFSFEVYGPYLFVGTINGVMLSTNKGGNWGNIGLKNNYIYCLVSNGTNLYAGMEKGLFINTNNGNNWVRVNNGITNTYIKNIASSGSNYIVGANECGIFLSSNNGSNWSLANNGLSNLSTYLLATDKDKFVAVLVNGELVYNSFTGNYWCEFNDSVRTKNIMCLAIIDSTIYAGTYSKGIIWSKDNFDNWTEINDGLPLRDTNYYTINNIVHSDSIIYAATDKGLYFKTYNDNSWIQLKNGINYSVEDLFIYGNNIIAYNSSRIYLSTDYGDSFKEIIFNHTYYSIKSLAIYGSNIFVCNSIDGVLLSTDYGQTWTECNDGLPNKNVYLKLKDKRLFAGTDGCGLYKLDVSFLDVNDEINNESLINLYPNPVQDKLNISFSSLDANNISVKIVNQLGMILYEKNFINDSNKNFYTIDVQKYPSGIYYCVIQSGKYTETKNIVIIR